MAKFLRIDHRIDGQRRLEVQILTPVDGAHGRIYVVGVRGLEMLDGLEDAYGGAQTEVGTVHHLFVAGKRHHAATDGHVVGAQFGQFLGQHFFQTLESLGDEFKFFH